ncbi:MAG: cyclic nucleotide-binding domain-containing protein [Firmicutes bacterium]|nr:cyclic nucleotide-binding domain-containing protein [Bacillota bacterium]
MIHGILVVIYKVNLAKKNYGIWTYVLLLKKYIKYNIYNKRRSEMENINNPRVLKEYVDKFNINSLFQDNMMEDMKLCKFNSEEIIFLEEEHIENFYFIVEGKVRVKASLKSGKEILLRFIQPFNTLGEIELMGDCCAKNRVESVKESLLIGISIDKMRKFAFEDIKFLKYINGILSHKISTIDKTMALNLTYPLDVRLANYLITINSTNENRINELETNDLNDIAEILGSSLRHLNRVIRDMSDLGILKKQNKKLLIQDYDKLKQMSAELYF